MLAALCPKADWFKKTKRSKALNSTFNEVDFMVMDPLLSTDTGAITRFVVIVDTVAMIGVRDLL